MYITGRIGRQILLYSLLLMIIPMIIFPERFGSTLGKASLINAMFELIFYGFVIYIFNRKASLIEIVQASGLCFIYRLIIGALFGFLIALMYSMNLHISLTMGVSSYLPGIYMHILGAPLVMKPLIEQIYGVQRERRVMPVPSSLQSTESGMTNIAISRDRRKVESSIEEIPDIKISTSTDEVAASAPSVQSQNSIGERNGFDNATGYIGETSAVRLVTVVDNEGLLLSSYTKGDLDPEDWAPYSIMYFENSEPILNRTGLQKANRFDLISGNDRLILAREDFFYLMVIADQHTEDMLKIRVNQGVDIIKKYIAERYSHEKAARTESKYVPSVK